MFGMSSFHSGGCNTMMGDGSVKFLKNSTANQVIWALGSMNQGEVVDAGSFLSNRLAADRPQSSLLYRVHSEGRVCSYDPMQPWRSLRW